MKILITGGAGFIGSHIVDFLIEKGCDVVVIDNFITGKKENLNEKAVLYELDITKDIDYIFEKEKPEKVIHLAAQVMLRNSLKDPLFDTKTNILGTLNILESCRKHGVKKIIYASAGGARVGEPEYLPVDEKHPINPSSPYGISKHSAEHYLWLYNYLYGIDYFIFCFGNVYGPRDDPSCGRVTSVFIDKMLKRENPIIFGDGEQTRDFIYVVDLAEFIVGCLEKNSQNKLFHLADGKQINVREIFNIIKKEMGSNKEAIYVEEIKGEVKNIILDTTLVKKELGWESKHSFEQGIKETIDYFKSKNYL